MGRNHRHKKDLKAEKAKTKLKQSKTKFLPKGLNVTNTNFKIKPIVLSDQLREKGVDVPLSKRKLNTKELLSRIKHYNENVRHGACEELTDMIKIHLEEIINQHLSDIILNVSTLMQDREQKVRKAAVKAIGAILENAPESKLEPFFGYFSTNMCCAMTNIDKTIQEDSLMFLDCFLKYKSGLIFHTSEKLLPNFFTLISKLRNDSNLGRTLTVNLGSKMTSITWRIKVLSRLHAVLEFILQNRHSVDEKLEDMDKIYKNAEVSNTFPIYKDSFSTILDSSSYNFENTQKGFSEPDVLNRHIVALVPLLYETWIEVVPEKKIGKAVSESTILNEEASAILSCIVNTLYLLWKYVRKSENESINVKNVFLSNAGQKFLNHLLTNFPYCQTENRTKRNKIKSKLKILETNSDVRCVKENLLICYMYCVLNINCLNNNLRIEMEAITAYVTKCLLTKKYIDNNSANILLEFLKSCLVEQPVKWKRAGTELKSILEKTITFYHHDAIGEKYKLEIFNILVNVADNPYLNRCQQYHDWLYSLPKLLCQSKVSDVLVKELLKLSRKNNEVFHKGILKELPGILENLETLQIVLTTTNLNNSEEIVKRNIVNILFFVPALYSEQLNAISSFMTKHPFSKYVEYFIDMLKLRLEMKNCEDLESELKAFLLV